MGRERLPLYVQICSTSIYLLAFATLVLEPACLDRILPIERLEKHSKSPSLCGTKESPNTFNPTERAISSEEEYTPKSPKPQAPN